MRFEKVEQILELAQMMQSTAEGIGLVDIESQFNVSRRTAERYRDAILRIFPDTEELIQEDTSKKWRLKSSQLQKLTYLTADELSDLNNAIEIMDKENMPTQSTTLKALLQKLKIINAKQLTRIESDLEILLENEKYATRIGPHPEIKTETLGDIRTALQSVKKLQIDYQKHWHKEIETRVIHPYGVLYGKKHYLVGYCEKSKGIRTFALPFIHKIKVLDEYYEYPNDFDLTEHSQKSFGIFQEEPFEVKWKFDGMWADDVKSHVFHPKQKFETLENGDIIVTFTAGGMQEMCWHLFTWGNSVEIIGPQELKERYIEMLKKVLERLD